MRERELILQLILKIKIRNTCDRVSLHKPPLLKNVKEVWKCDLNYHKNLVNFCFEVLQELLIVLEAISNT